VSSSSSFRHVYPSIYLLFNYLFQQAVPTQDVTNPVSFPSSYFMWDIYLRHAVAQLDEALRYKLERRGFDS
jgi:hypothetical protein